MKAVREKKGNFPQNWGKPATAGRDKKTKKTKKKKKNKQRSE